MKEKLADRSDLRVIVGANLFRWEAAVTTRDIPEIDTQRLADDLNRQGYATIPLLAPAVCQDIAGLYDDPSRFRKRIVMEQRGYGCGEYQYFTYPLPPLIADLRRALYGPLAAIVNDWCRVLAEPPRFPAALDDYLASCHAVGQTKATPLLLRYATGGFNCLHRDLYGEEAFPLQITVLLSEPSRDFTGGEFLLVEQWPDAQARGMVVPLQQGEAVIFPTRHRPMMAHIDKQIIAVQHGVSTVRSGRRETLGLIFHDAS